MLFKQLDEPQVILLVFETDQLILFLRLGIVNLRFYFLQLTVHLLEVLVRVLHLPLFLSDLLLKFYHFVVGLGQGGFVELQVIVGHLSLLLNVFILELLEVGAYLAKVVDNREHLRLSGIEFVLQLAHCLRSLLLSLHLGVRV